MGSSIWYFLLRGPQRCVLRSSYKPTQSAGRNLSHTIPSGLQEAPKTSGNLMLIRVVGLPSHKKRSEHASGQLLLGQFQTVLVFLLAIGPEDQTNKKHLKTTTMVYRTQRVSRKPPTNSDKTQHIHYSTARMSLVSLFLTKTVWTWKTQPSHVTGKHVYHVCCFFCAAESSLKVPTNRFLHKWKDRNYLTARCFPSNVLDITAIRLLKKPSCLGRIGWYFTVWSIFSSTKFF